MVNEWETGVVVPIQIREDHWVRIGRIPHDLTPQEAERIANVTYTAPTETGEVETLLDQSTARAPAPLAGTLPRVGRNEPCPCGSGKKYKQCHGKLA